MKQYRNLETHSNIHDSKYYKSVGKGLMKYWPLIQKNIRSLNSHTKINKKNFLSIKKK